jgi:hypothetical protein
LGNYLLRENGRKKVLGRGLTAYISRYMVIKKGVIKDVPEDMELEN